jgi:hypothetical protein
VRREKKQKQKNTRILPGSSLTKATFLIKEYIVCKVREGHSEGIPGQ